MSDAQSTEWAIMVLRCGLAATLGERLQAARRLRQLSREDVATQVGVPAKAQARLERGEVHTSKYLPILLDFYGLRDAAETVVMAFPPHNPPVSRASFAQAWLRVMELWLQARVQDTTTVNVVPGAAPTQQVMDALQAIRATLSEPAHEGGAQGDGAQGDGAGEDATPVQP